MTGQYQVTKEEEKKLRELVEKYIDTYWGDLWEDHDILIGFANPKEYEGKSWAYVQID